MTQNRSYKIKSSKPDQWTKPIYTVFDHRFQISKTKLVHIMLYEISLSVKKETNYDCFNGIK